MEYYQQNYPHLTTTICVSMTQTPIDFVSDFPYQSTQTSTSIISEAPWTFSIWFLNILLIIFLLVHLLLFLYLARISAVFFGSSFSLPNPYPILINLQVQPILSPIYAKFISFPFLPTTALCWVISFDLDNYCNNLLTVYLALDLIFSNLFYTLLAKFIF